MLLLFLVLLFLFLFFFIIILPGGDWARASSSACYSWGKGDCHLLDSRETLATTISFGGRRAGPCPIAPTTTLNSSACVHACMRSLPMGPLIGLSFHLHLRCAHMHVYDDASDG